MTWLTIGATAYRLTQVLANCAEPKKQVTATATEHAIHAHVGNSPFRCLGNSPFRCLGNSPSSLRRLCFGGGGSLTLSASNRSSVTVSALSIFLIPSLPLDRR